MYLCRLEIPKSEVRIPLKSNDLLFLNISYNLEKVLLSIQTYCLLLLIHVCMFLCQLADFIVSNKNAIWGGELSSNTDWNKIIQKPSLVKTSCRKPNKSQLYSFLNNRWMLHWTPKESELQDKNLFFSFLSNFTYIFTGRRAKSVSRRPSVNSALRSPSVLLNKPIHI